MSHYFNKTFLEQNAHIIAQLLDKFEKSNSMDRMDSQKYAKIAIILSQTAFSKALIVMN